MSARSWCNPSEWERAGQGRAFQFYATDDDVDRHFRELPPKFGPYGIVGTSLIKGERGYQHQAFTVTPEEWFHSVRHSSQPPLTNYWLWSGVAPSVIPNHAAEGWCGLNGMILLRHGGASGGKREVSCISLLDRVFNPQTGELREHTQQAAVFRALKRAIKRELVFATMHDFKDGRVVEDDQSYLMTPAAAELAAGYFDRLPGRRLK